MAYDRQTAVKIKVDELINGTFVKGEGEFDPSLVNVANRSVGRVNLMGDVVDITDLKDYFSLDDGSGIIEVRNFDNDIEFNFNVGDLVNVIGKLREFNYSIFLVREIIKSIDPAWVKLRNKELSLEPVIDTSKKEESLEVKSEIKPEVKDEQVVEQKNPPKIIMDCIKKLDDGQGADFDTVVDSSGVDGAEEIINRLLEEGGLFEVKSGRLKVLE